MLPDPFRDVSQVDKKLFADLKLEARREAKTCRICGKSTSKNHVFPKQYLKKVTGKDHLFLLAEDDVYEQGRHFHQYYFDKVGADKTRDSGFGMQAFCSDHDHEIFKSLDNLANIENLIFRDFMLLAYKSMAHECSKIENGLLHGKKLKQHLPNIYKSWGFQQREENEAGFGVIADLNIDIEAASNHLFKNEPPPFFFYGYVIERKIEFFIF